MSAILRSVTASSDGPSRPPTVVPGRSGKRRPQGARPVTKKQGGRPTDNRKTSRARARQRQRTFIALGSTAVVILIIAAFVVVRVTSAGPSNDLSAAAVPSSEYQQLSSVSEASLVAAAKGYDLSAVSGSYPSTISGPSITQGGKPEVLYIGAEYCPYCATERWPLVVALSKFGIFSGLNFIHSDNVSTETYREVPTLSFYKSTYVSRYLSFVPVEEQTVTGATLQQATAPENALVSKFDSGGSIPFVYFDGKASIIGAEYNPPLLIGKKFSEVTSEISAGTTPLASSVQADAGAIISELCQVTGGKPGNVCSLFPHAITRFP